MSEQQTEQDIFSTDEMSVERAKDAKKTLKRLIKLLFKQKILYLILTLVFVSTILSLFAPLVIGEAIDLILSGLELGAIPFRNLVKVLGVLGILYLGSALFNYFQQYMMASVAQKMTLSLRQELAIKLSKLPLKYFDERKKGDILSRVTNDLERVSDTLQQGLMQLFTTVFTIVAALVIMFNISALLSVITVVTLILGLVVTAIVTGKSHQLFTENQRALGEFNGYIEEIYTGHLVLKVFNKEEDVEEIAKEHTYRLKEANKRAEFIMFAITPIIRLFNQFGYVVIAVIGGIFVLQGRLSLGLVQAFFQYVNQVSEPITEAAYIFNSLQNAIASAERAFELIDATEERIVSVKEEVKMATGEVAFNNVSFSYDENKSLIEDLTLKIKPGQKVAIVGPTGAGKTTLINLLMRFYEIQSGEITIDGQDISRLTRQNLRQNIGMVLQDTWLFKGTIEENIAYGRVGATKEEIIAAAKASRCDHFIKTLSDGYQTVLSEDASNISQGQRQLLTIARAILANPKILILDEATSSVDTRTEVEIQKAMNTLMENKTSFIIAHRLSTIRHADCILVMNQGSVIEQGTHDELLSAEGFYAKLYRSQFEG